MVFLVRVKNFSNLLSCKNFSQQIIKTKYICITGMEFESDKNNFYLVLWMKRNCVFFNRFRPNITFHYNAFHIKVYDVVLSSVSDKAKLLAENVTKNSNLDDAGISLPALTSKTNLKLDNIHVTKSWLNGS